MKEHVVERNGLVVTHQFCPDRAYIELDIPDDARSVSFVEFKVVSRDQGWADGEGHSYTFFDASVRRPPNRPELRTLTLFDNDRGVADFKEHRARWGHNSAPAQLFWCTALRPGDFIQLVPRSAYTGWVNFVNNARITVGYEPITKETPGIGADAVECFLMHSQLKSGQEFDTLSYCWGDLADIETIIMDSSSIGGAKETVQISASVGAALRQLRYQNKTRMIWIDQLCINQHDLEERA
ncbi:hypothetical protein B0O99DRAFT_651296 [Bisporella sp. PMI_857]|nr:hypothetical protein B0O99DRAFT_651296 [Bisporella sp. PMI_857]